MRNAAPLNFKIALDILCDQRPNYSSMLTGSVLLTSMQCLFTFCSQTEVANGIISGRVVSHIAHHKADNLAYWVNSLWRNSTQIRWRWRFEDFLQDNFRPEEASDVISDVAIDDVGLAFHVKFGCSLHCTSARSRTENRLCAEQAICIVRFA